MTATKLPRGVSRRTLQRENARLRAKLELTERQLGDALLPDFKADLERDVETFSRARGSAGVEFGSLHEYPPLGGSTSAKKDESGRWVDVRAGRYFLGTPKPAPRPLNSVCDICHCWKPWSQRPDETRLYCEDCGDSFEPKR